MQRPLIAILLFLFSATRSFACHEDPRTLELRNAIYDNRIDHVEALLSESQSDFEAGILTAEQMRCLFAHFERTRPETSDFIDAWRSAYPASSSARIAKAMFLAKISWSVRGEAHASETYPAALQAFDEMQRTVWRLATEAFDETPRSIAASDVIIHAANPNRRKAEARAAVADIMSTDPNQGTLDKAMGTILTGWGGTWSDVETLCDAYADKVPGAGKDARLICLLKGARKFPETYDWMVATLRDADLPELDHLRAWELTSPTATAEEAEAAYRYLTREKNIDVMHAYRFDQFVAKRYGYPFLSERITRFRHEHAKGLLVHDPLNPQLIGWYLEQIVRVLDSDDTGMLTTEPVWAPSDEELYDFAERLLIASPYDPERWHYYLNRLVYVKGNRADRPFRTNVIVYSNHSPASLASHILSLRGHYNAVHIGRQEGASEKLREIAETTDLDTDVICPFVRATRLHALVCRGNTDPACEVKPERLKDEYIKILAEADMRGICRAEREAEAEDLFYRPVPVGNIRF